MPIARSKTHIIPYSLRDEMDENRPTFGIGGMGSLLAWLEHKRPELVVLPDTLHVIRCLKELTDKGFCGITGDEAPAVRRRLWEARQDAPFLINQLDTRRFVSKDPDAFAHALVWNDKQYCLPALWPRLIEQSRSPHTQESLEARTISQPLMLVGLADQLAIDLRHASTASHVIWIMEGVARHQRTSTIRHLQGCFKDRELHALFQDHSTLAQCLRAENALTQEHPQVILCDLTVARALDFTHALPLHAIYERKHAEHIAPWWQAMHLHQWASFTYHPHEWWRHLTRLDIGLE